MSRNDLVASLTLKPFEPFRIVTSDGTNYDIHHPDVDEGRKSAKGGPDRRLRRDRFASNASFSSFSPNSRSILYPFRTALVGEEKKVPAPQKRVRITFAPGVDILPVFSKDGKKIMWTSTRDGRQPAQLYIADFVPPKD
jgi:hypothetical protein